MSNIREMVNAEIKRVVDLLLAENKSEPRGVDNGYTIDCCSVGQAVNYIHDNYGKIIDDDLDTNGWQADYWQTGTYLINGRKVAFDINGSGYYGGITIGLGRMQGDCDFDCDNCNKYNVCEDYVEGGHVNEE
ncbi:MAG: hypothetical protein ACRDD8_15975 [Bacteroidales bacterium]